MSAATKVAAEVLVSGDLENAELAQAFTAPLNDLIKCGISKVVLNFDSKGEVYVNSMNDSHNCICNMSYNKDFIAALDVKKTTELGIYELREFVGLTTLAGSNGCDIQISEGNAVNVSSDNMVFNFLGSVADTIKQGPKSLAAQLTWFAEFKWNAAEFSTFSKAMGMLSQDYVKLTGKAGENTLSLTVCDKDIRTSTFKANIDLEDEVEEDFSVVFNKDTFMAVTGGSVKDLTVQISDKVLSFRGSSDYHDIKYYLTACDEN